MTSEAGILEVESALIKVSTRLDLYLNVSTSLK